MPSDCFTKPSAYGIRTNISLRARLWLAFSDATFRRIRLFTRFDFACSFLVGTSHVLVVKVQLMSSHNFRCTCFFFLKRYIIFLYRFSVTFHHERSPFSSLIEVSSKKKEWKEIFPSASTENPRNVLIMLENSVALCTLIVRFCDYLPNGACP